MQIPRINLINYSPGSDNQLLRDKTLSGQNALQLYNKVTFLNIDESRFTDTEKDESHVGLLSFSRDSFLIFLRYVFSFSPLSTIILS